MQARNFCLNKTTSERFAKAKVVQESRTSTYLESTGGQSFMDDDVLGSSIVEAMQTRDHSHRSAPCLHNCYDMCCLSEYPDQVKIFNIQSGKNARIADDHEQPALLGVISESSETTSSINDSVSKPYNKTPKPRSKNS